MKKVHNHLFFSLFTLLVTIIVAGAYIYIYRAVGSSVDRVNETRVKIQTQKTNASHEQNIIDLYKSTADDWMKLPKFFIPSDRVVIFIEAIEALGAKSKTEVSLTSVDADNLDGQPSGTIGVIKGHVDAVGTWSAVMKTLVLAESLPYPLSIDRVVLTMSGPSGNARNQFNSWRLSFDISTKEIVMAGSSISN